MFIILHVVSFLQNKRLISKCQLSAAQWNRRLTVGNDAIIQNEVKIFHINMCLQGGRLQV